MAISYGISPSRVEIYRRLTSMETFMVRIFTGPLSQDMEFVSVEAEKGTPACDVVKVAVRKLRLGPRPDNYELAEVFSSGGLLCKERRLEAMENPVRVQLLWPRVINAEVDNGQGLHTGYRFYIRKAEPESQRVSGWVECKDASVVDTFLSSFLKQPTSNKEYPDLCNLPDLNEKTLLENLKARFENSNIYTYVGSILIAVNPFKFFPIYNPKYVKMYQNKWLGELPPHIFAIADAAYSTMLRSKQNQCIVISGESGSGKTESTNLLLHHLTALSHKGLHGSGVEQTILGAGPVLEAFGNAKTVHNNNSSRFGKFIQVNYKENGMVHGAIVEKYLLEKSRIVSQAKDERNYHVFYYLLAGADKNERDSLHLGTAQEYYYLSQSACYNVEGMDEMDEFARLKQSMEMVGFSPETQRRIFAVLSAVLHLGNIEFRKKGDQHHDESVAVKNESTVTLICNLLKVKEKTVMEALTTKKTVAGGETVVINYKMEDAIATRDAMAKCLYSSLFDWIVLKVNQALLAKKHNSEHQVVKESVLPNLPDTGPLSPVAFQGQEDLETDPLALGNSIGVLDIFGFEDFGKNSFEQFCINYANEHLQYYFNQHIFKLEQEEYEREGIQWKNIEFIDNTACLELFFKKPKGLLHLMDEECNFPGATNDTLLTKFTDQHKNNRYYKVPQLREHAFVIEHYAGKVKYGIQDFREKNADLVRTDIVGVLKKSTQSFVRELVGIDPVAVLRWSIVRAFFRCYHAFRHAGERYRKHGGPEKKKLKKRLSDSQIETTIGENLLRLCGLSRNELMEGSIVKKQGEDGPGSGREPPSHSSQHVNLARACSPTYEESFSEDDGILYKRHGDLMHDEKILESHMSASDTRVIRRARKLIMRSRSFKPKPRPSLSFRDIKTLKAIASRTMISFGGSRVGSKKQPPTVGAQFQWSLSRLMHTLNKANPFFIRCIKSNADKAPCEFNDEIVLRQLRYTGMLATVKIRQSGYNYRLTFEEFIQLYKILLPKGLLSSKDDVKMFLETMDLTKENYQIGKTKVFLRESEKLMLDEALHRAIMKRVVRIQRWAKAILERQNYVRLRNAVILAQRCTRRWKAQRSLSQLRLEYDAAVAIQKWYRCLMIRRWYLTYQRSVIIVQTSIRAFLARKRHREMLVARDHKRRFEEEKVRQKVEDLQSSTSDEGVLLKGSSGEELESDYRAVVRRRDSEESSGILEDSESETASDTKSRVISGTPPVTPTSAGSGSVFISTPENKDDTLEQVRASGRVHKLKEAFQQSPSSSQDENDGRKLYIRRGSQRWRGREQSPAPLAKQESFSDMELSPTKPSGVIPTSFPLSSDRLQAIEHAVAKGREKLDSQGAASDSDKAQTEGSGATHLSPFHKVQKRFKNIMGGTKGKKDRSADSDDDLEDANSSSNKTSPSRRPHDLGVAVLPPHPSAVPQSPLSPQKEKEKDFTIATHHGWQRKQRKKKQRRSGGGAGKGNQETQQSRGNWKVEGMSQWQYPAELVITDLSELMYLDEFIGRKQKELSKNEGKPATIFDQIFQGAIQEFRKTLKALVGTESQKSTVLVRYRDLLANFEQSLSAEVKHARHNATFPVTMGINAFRGFLDEFIKNHAGKKRDEKKKEEKKVENKNAKKDKQRKDAIEHLGHKFLQVQFNIPTFCELCSSLIWIMEKGQVCQVCKYTCHKKCCTKSVPSCRGAQDTQGKGTSQVFGAPLDSQITEGLNIPKIAEKLIQNIELRGLFTEGLYRKSGAAPKVRNLRQVAEADCPESGAHWNSDDMVENVQNAMLICTTHSLLLQAFLHQIVGVGHIDVDSIDFEEYPVHVLASTLKCYFRELPEPLLTFDLYDDFLRVADIKDHKEKIQSLFSVIERLPKANYDLFERLMFHLARVAMHEESNKMSCNGLAIIFAPCLLRSNKVMQAQESLNQVPRQTLCIEYVLLDQLLKVKATFENIHTLEDAEKSASDRLSFVRASIREPKKRPVSLHQPVTPMPVKEEDEEEEEETLLMEEERVLSAHIASIHKEKDNLTHRLPVLEPRQASSDEDMLTGDEFESSFDNMDDIDDYQDEFATTFDLPVSQPSLHHLNKRRTAVPSKKPPSKYSAAVRQAQYRQDSLDSAPDDELDDIPVPTITVNTADTSGGSFVDHMVIESSFVSIPDFKDIGDEDEIMV